MRDIRTQAEVVATVEQALERVATLPAFQSPFVDLQSGAALAAAHALDDSSSGLLSGIPVAVKDIIGVAGTRMRAGSRVIEREVVEDAAVVALLRAHEAIVLGTTRLDELAFGVTGLNPHDEGCRNPQDTARVSGGSSSGSALAVAEGICPIALGTDTGGSVRIPAAFCGIVGYKPSFGAIPTTGVLPLSPTLDHVGVLARCVADVCLAADALSPYRDAGGPDLEELRIGVLEDGAVDADRDVARAFEELLSLFAGHRAGLETVSLGTPTEIMEISTVVLFYEASRVHADALRNHADDLGPYVLTRLQKGAAISSEEYRAALHARQTLLGDAEELFGRVDLLIGPTVPIVPPITQEAGDPSIVSTIVRNTRLHNILGSPAVSIPLPTGPWPTGLQIAASRGRDWTTLRAARRVEELLS